MTDYTLAQEMESILKIESEKYDQLRQLSLEQLALLQNDQPDVDRVAELMNQKYDLVNALQAMESQHQEVKERWRVAYETLSLEDREPVARQKDETLAIIEATKNLEDEIAKLLMKCSKDVGNRLKSLHKEKQASRAYLNVSGGPPRFIDKKK